MKKSTRTAQLRLMNNLRRFACLLPLFLLFLQPNAHAQCPGDVTLPTAACVASLALDVAPGGMLTVQAADLNNGSSDNCTDPVNLQFFIEEGAPSASPPSTSQLQFAAAQAGPHTLVLWVVDEAGNASFCTVNLQVSVCQSAIVMVCNDNITVSLPPFGTYDLVPDDILEGGPYCNYYHYVVDIQPFGNATPFIALSTPDIGSHIVQVTCVETGNSCWGTVIVDGNCGADTIQPVAVCDQVIGVVLDTAAAATAELTALMIDDGSYDNCTAPANLDFRLEDLAQTNNTPPASQSLNLGLPDVGTFFARMWAGDESGNWNSCVAEVSVSLVVVHRIEGSVFVDGNGDCLYQSAQENGLSGWTVRATGVNTGAVFIANTNPSGQYNMNVDIAETAFEVSVDAPFNYGGGVCGTTYAVSFPGPTLGAVVAQDVPVVLDDTCPLMFVDLATPKIRPCFPGTYFIHYGNVSIQTIADTYVDLTLDEALAFQGSSPAGVNLGNQTYRFETGDLAAGESGWITVNFFTDCDALPGATHCSEAHIFPDTLCPNSPQWSGANVEVEGSCVNDTIYLKIKNTGSGPNAQPLDFIVVEDVLMLQSGTFSLNSGAELDLAPIAGDGSTFRLEAEQEPGHPYGGMPSVSVEGCGGFTPGLVTLFPTNNANPFIAEDCRENTSSFDPNDKQALPSGYDDAHFIEKNTSLDYMIRFQNTGTDTAFRVVIVDTLSALLDAGSVLPGASSHAYRFERIDGNVLRFIFDDILLPDSNVNVAASQGFVQFQVRQMPDNPDGSVIENSAAIYFDFNAPVITNLVFHTVGHEFIVVSANEAPAGLKPLLVYPNPATDRVFFDADERPEASLRFTLTDARGRTVRSMEKVLLPLSFERGSLEAGVYFFRFTGAGGELLWSGKVIVR